jgi:hypothetical protein
MYVRINAYKGGSFLRLGVVSEAGGGSITQVEGVKLNTGDRKMSDTTDNIGRATVKVLEAFGAALESVEDAEGNKESRRTDVKYAFGRLIRRVENNEEITADVLRSACPWWVELDG